MSKVKSHYSNQRYKDNNSKQLYVIHCNYYEEVRDYILDKKQLKDYLAPFINRFYLRYESKIKNQPYLYKGTVKGYFIEYCKECFEGNKSHNYEYRHKGMYEFGKIVGRKNETYFARSMSYAELFNVLEMNGFNYKHIYKKRRYNQKYNYGYGYSNKVKHRPYRHIRKELRSAKQAVTLQESYRECMNNHYYVRHRGRKFNFKDFNDYDLGKQSKKGTSWKNKKIKHQYLKHVV